MRIAWSSVGVGLVAACTTGSFAPEIPVTWDEAALARLELPLVDAERSPRHASAERYDALPVRPVHRSYPVYHPDREPVGYRAWLAEQEPQVVFDVDALRTEQDWIDAGALVFAQPIGFDGPVLTSAMVGDATWFERHGVPVAADGTMPFARWVVRERGKPELGNFSCAMCHTRVLDDGSVIVGAQGNIPFAAIMAERFRVTPTPVVRHIAAVLTAAPWAEDRGAAAVDSWTRERIADAFSMAPRGVFLRQGTGMAAPAKAPDLIGIRDRAYLDSTGLVRHRSIGDLMRYAALNQGMDVLADFDGFVPAGTRDGRFPFRSESRFVGTDARYGDAQLYALARYLYSLEPPPSPFPYDVVAARGRAVFERERCDACHTPPLYTNNELVPVDGFSPPRELRRSDAVSHRRVGTDPRLATSTRRGTGFYKVPSLKGLWYRGPLEHSGSIATLEDWFDARRHDGDYVPTGYRGDAPRAVPGHPFGLALDDDDKRALIAFLRTL